MLVTAATAEPLAAPCPRSTNGAGSWAEETSAVKTTLGTVCVHQLTTTLGSLDHDDGTWLMTVRYTVQQEPNHHNHNYHNSGTNNSCQNCQNGTVNSLSPAALPFFAK